MLKKKAINRIFLVTISFFIVFVIFTFTRTYEKQNEFAIKKNNIDNKIYLPNKNDIIVTSAIYINNNLSLEEKVKQTLETMITDNNKNSLLPSDIKPILPRNTKINDITVENNILKVDFSKELLDINKEQSENMLSSLIYTLTSFDNIIGIEISAEGTLLQYAPNTNKVLNTILTREYGINKIYDLSSTNNIKKVYIYYADEKNRDALVTNYLNSTDDKVNIIIKKLANNINNDNLSSYLDSNIKLISYNISDNVIILNFNKKIDDEKSLLMISKSIFANYEQNIIRYEYNNNIFYEIKREDI